MLNFKLYDELSKAMNDYGLQIKDFTREEIDNIIKNKKGSNWTEAMNFVILRRIISYSSKMKSVKTYR